MPDLTAANKLLTKRMLLVWIAATGLYFVALADISILSALAIELGSLVPAVRQQFDKNTAMGYLAGCYGGLAVVFLPFATLFILQGQDILARFSKGTQVPKRWRLILFNYMIGLPFILTFLAAIYFAPIDITENPKLFGEIVVRAMIDSKLGLLVLGSLLVVATALLQFVLAAYLLWPLLALTQMTRK